MGRASADQVSRNGGMVRHGAGRLLLTAAICVGVPIGSAVGLLAQAPDSASIDGSTPLQEAIRRNDLAGVKALIARGTDVNAASRYGVLPLGLAALNGNTAIVGALLDAGANANAATPGGETALMTAARAGSLDAVKLLLDRRAAVDAKTSPREQTALIWAVTENHPDIVKLLVARGADVNAHTAVLKPKGEYVPARAGFAAGTGLVRQRALPTPEGGMTPLLFAVRDGNVAMMRLLLELGADLEQASGNHTSPLLIAIVNGQAAIAHERLAKGREANAADNCHR